MTEKLRSHLRKAKGFTLVELLIVIAIIAILVLIVIVAINPLQRIHDTNDRRAEADIRSTATVVEGCLAFTNPATGVTNAAGDCDTEADLEAAATPGGPWSRNVPANITFSGTGLLPVTLCKNGGTGDSAFYTTTTGDVTHRAGTAC